MSFGFVTDFNCTSQRIFCRGIRVHSIINTLLVRKMFKSNHFYFHVNQSLTFDFKLIWRYENRACVAAPYSPPFFANLKSPHQANRITDMFYPTSERSAALPVTLSPLQLAPSPLPSLGDITVDICSYVCQSLLDPIHGRKQ